ncbi:hypothetical protein TNIN_336601 [Trichonephila inaurata madagascariensis]|uniref:Uncharacterized protein n=1 Tax=Trichonephila inaurata madagascariensis TaxID=2747483 RepID=A0A8X6JYU0_9ARAC|nr:hypothetical protein TNIN_336601 [Trichonephila inaurata madagascariensis]
MGVGLDRADRRRLWTERGAEGANLPPERSASRVCSKCGAPGPSRDWDARIRRRNEKTFLFFTNFFFRFGAFQGPRPKVAKVASKLRAAFTLAESFPAYQTFSPPSAVRELRARLKNGVKTGTDFQRGSRGPRRAGGLRISSRAFLHPEHPRVIFGRNSGTPEFRTPPVAPRPIRDPPSGARSGDCRSQSRIFSRRKDSTGATFGICKDFEDGPVRS